MSQNIDIVAFAVAASLMGLLFAQMGKALYWAMATENDLLGFMPKWAEKHFGIESKVYHLITCNVCLSGQSALWLSFLLYEIYPYQCTEIFHILTIGSSIWWASKINND